MFGLGPETTGALTQVLAATGCFTVLDIGIGQLVKRLPMFAQWPSYRRQSLKLRLISTAHATVALSLSLYSVAAATLPVLSYGLFDADRLRISTQALQVTTAFSTGYFVWDTVVCLLDVKAAGGMFVVHAIACLTAYATSRFASFAQLYLTLFLLYEVSTVAINVEWILSRVSGEPTPKSLARLANALAGFSSFFFFRIVLGTVASLYFLSDVWYAYFLLLYFK